MQPWTIGCTKPQPIIGFPSDGLQLLGELGVACRQFARPLELICDEMARAVFSGYYTSDDGSLQLKQLPYFAVVQRLETEKEHLLREAEGLRAALQKSKVSVFHSSWSLVFRAPNEMLALGVQAQECLGRRRKSKKLRQNLRRQSCWLSRCAAIRVLRQHRPKKQRCLSRVHRCRLHPIHHWKYGPCHPTGCRISLLCSYRLRSQY